MSDFNKYSNYNENSSHSSVVFGAESPLLEVELNELQQIINTKLSRIINSIGSCVIPVEEDSITFDDSTKTLSITNSIIIEDSGLTAYVKSSSIVISGANSVAYFEMKEVEATRYSTLKEYGNTAGEEVENTIKDNRTLSETSRRKVVTYTLMCGSSIPSNTDTIKYVEVGSYDGSNFNFKKTIKQIIDCIQDTYAKKSLYDDESVNVGRKPDSTIGEKSFAFGKNVTASGDCSFAVGIDCEASGDYSHAEGDSSKAKGIGSHAEGSFTTASGDYSHAEGNMAKATANYSHAEGSNTKAIGYESHAEGSVTTASGDQSHAEGGGTTASGDHSHAEGSVTTASNHSSHAEGDNTTASGWCSHAEGESTIASGNESHAEGFHTTASKNYAHAEGYYTTASSSYAHAEGNSTTASGESSHAGGSESEASGECSFAHGECVKADVKGSVAFGIANEMQADTLFALGNGSGKYNRSNAMSVSLVGALKTASTVTASTTADYAEFFEWLDGNVDSEDRVGKFVTLDGNKIRIATDEDDYILGVISGQPFVLGTGDCDVWNGMYLRDKFRRRLLEPAPKTEPILDENGRPTREQKEVLDDEGNVVYEGERLVLNPEYDNTKPYVNRADRPEWDAVGMLGVLPVIHDGTAKVNGYVTVNKDGIATSCDKSHENAYRVIHENSEDVVEIIFRN